MEKNKKIYKYLLIIFISISLIIPGSMVKANSDTEEFKNVEYSKEYKEWLQLTDEEKANTIKPSMYNTTNSKTIDEQIKSSSNIFKIMKLLSSSNELVTASYYFPTQISNNIVVRNQKGTNDCWAFTTLADLEANLATENFNNKKNADKVYDFSERHMRYSTLYGAFLNNKTNKYGVNLSTTSGGSFNRALAYLTNGMGAVNEASLPFENNEDNIDISNIENKSTTATVLDSFIIDDSNSKDSNTMKNTMKSYIKQYGGIYSGLAVPTSKILDSDYYNNVTSALYDPTDKVNHAALIIGWDDNFSKTNFNSKNQPSGNGAWIIKNSWGTGYTITYDDAYNMYLAYQKKLVDEGYIILAVMPTENDVLEYLKKIYGTTPTKDGDSVFIPYSNNGYMYISYYDPNIYSYLSGIEKSEENKDYDNLYQHDVAGIGNAISVSCKNAYLANVFTRDSSKKEELTKVSINTINGYTCKIYVNSSNSDKSETNLKQVSTDIGDIIQVEPGYHTYNLKTPIELTGSSFVVAFQIIGGSNNSQILIPFEANTSIISGDDEFKYVEVNEGESYIALDDEYKTNLNWVDTVNMVASYISDNNVGIEYKFSGNLLIKAFTNNIKPEKTITKISIKEQPTKNSYIQNTDQLDLTGGVIEVNYSDNTTSEISMKSTDVKASGFDNSIVGSQYITLTYKGFTAKFPITVTAKKSNTNTNTISNNNVIKNPTTDNPISSDFSKVKANTTSAELRMYTDLNKEGYSIINIDINNIKLGSLQDSYTYYYCLLTKNNETNIPNEYWVKIDSSHIIKNNDGTEKINLIVDTRELPNYSELANVNTCYLYLKELASNNGNTIESINRVKVTNENSKLTIYKDDKILTDDNIKNDITNVISSIGNQIINNNNDTTLATKSIPQTGATIGINLIIIATIIIGVVSYIVYKKRKNMLLGK